MKGMRKRREKEKLTSALTNCEDYWFIKICQSIIKIQFKYLPVRNEEHRIATGVCN